MTITAEMVKTLRVSTGAGMMDCKKALDESKGDMDAAIDWLRKKGLAAAAKKATRIASEGLVAVNTKATIGAVVEVNSETDFVSRNADFQNFVRQCAELGLGAKDLDALLATNYPDTSHSTAEEVTAQIARIGENLSLRRMQRLEVEEGAVVSYIHNAASDGMGKIGVLVALTSAADTGALQDLGKQLAMHIAATAPASLNADDLDPDFVARERQVLVDQAMQEGKPQDIAEKMVEGRMKKFIKEVVLMEQIFVMDGESTISDVIKKASTEAGKPITLSAFVRFKLGEGIDKEEKDFAAEVAEQLGS